MYRNVNKKWNTAVDEAADTIGEMLIELAGGEATYSHDDIADAALASGIAVLLGEGPDPSRTEAAARALYEALHDEKRLTWDTVNAIEKPFWLDIARAVIGAADTALLDQAGRGRRRR